MKNNCKNSKFGIFRDFARKKSRSRGFGILPSGFFERKQNPNPRDLGIRIPKKSNFKATSGYEHLFRADSSLRKVAKFCETDRVRKCSGAVADRARHPQAKRVPNLFLHWPDIFRPQMSARQPRSLIPSKKKFREETGKFCSNLAASFIHKNEK